MRPSGEFSCGFDRFREEEEKMLFAARIDEEIVGVGEGNCSLMEVGRVVGMFVGDGEEVIVVMGITVGDGVSVGVSTVLCVGDGMSVGDGMIVIAGEGVGEGVAVGIGEGVITGTAMTVKYVR